MDEFMKKYYNSNDVIIWSPEFKKLTSIGNYQSLIWTERYTQCGEFELYVKADPELMKYIKCDNLVSRDFRVPFYEPTFPTGEITRTAYPEFMIIEKVIVKTDVEDGNYIIASGRSLESILDRRVLTDNLTFTHYSVGMIMLMITDEVVNNKPAFPWLLQMYNTFWSGSHYDVWAEQFYPVTEPIRGSVLLELAQNVFTSRKCGFRFLHQHNKNDVVYGYVYLGNDRTGAVKEFPAVIFSPEYHNLVSSEYTYDSTTEKNACYTASDGEWFEEVKTTAHYNGVKTEGLNYREMFLKSDVPLKDDEGNSRGRTVVESELNSKGSLELLNHRPTETFNFEVKSTDRYIYQKDYFLGDLVRVDNGFGITAAARVTEVNQVWDETGYKIVPILEVEY